MGRDCVDLLETDVDKVPHLVAEGPGGEARRWLVHNVLQQLEYGHRFVHTACSSNTIGKGVSYAENSRPAQALTDLDYGSNIYKDTKPYMLTFLKNLPVKVLGSWRQVFICLRSPSPSPLPVTHCMNTYSHREGGGR